MNPKYLFTIEGISSNMLCPFDVIRGKVWDVEYGGWEDGNGYETPFFELENTGYQILTADDTEVEVNAIAYDSNKQYLGVYRMAYNTYYPFITLDYRIKYVQLSIPDTLAPEDYYFGTAEEFDSWLNNIVNPIWKDLSLNVAKESGQEFFRRKLNGSLTFVRDDYDTIMSQDFDFQYVLRIFKSDDNGKNWEDYWKGHFYRTDCEINEDDKYIRVEPSVDDEYVDILAGLEKEYNLIDLDPAITEIRLKKRPIIQMALAQSDGIIYGKASCFKVDGTYWEQDCKTISSNVYSVMTGTYFFNLAAGLCEVTITPQGTAPSNLPTHVKDRFVGHAYDMGNNRYEYALRITVNNYRIEYNYEDVTIYVLNLLNNVRWYGTLVQGVTQTVPCTSGGYDPLSIKFDTLSMLFARLIFDKAGVQNARDIPADDFMEDNENYRFLLQYYDVNSAIYFTDEYSTIPTKWGKHDATHYWITPTVENVSGWSPITPSLWDDVAYWFGYSQNLYPTENATMQEVPLKNAYKLEDCISALLKKVAPNIKLVSSTFLSGVDPITGDTRTFFITPKSNVKKIDYDTPAMNAPITLKYIFDMLRDGYKCYWYIEDGELHLEHLCWFLYGGDYDSSHTEVGIDLTDRFVTRNGKSWAFCTNKYTFDKPELTERYEFSWMDEETLPFNGEPINMIGNFVEQGKVEKINIQQFSSDVDYIMTFPDNISDDGFVLMGAVYDSGTGRWSLPFRQFEYMDNVILQNPYCAFVYMEEYYLYDLPSNKYQIGDGAITTIGWNYVMRFKTSEASFPCPTDPDMQKLVKTSIGEGQFEKLSINLSSRNGKATLKYNPYESVE